MRKMIGWIVVGILVALFVLLAIGDIIRANAPEGYEDKDGWHRG
jgi:hypothetical protein